MSPVRGPHRKPTRSQQQAIAFAERLILQVCRASPDPTYLQRLRTNLTRQGIRAAVAEHNTPALFDWLMEVVSYQGISDSIAWSYMEQHGRVTWAEIDAAFARCPSCPKLASFDDFWGCGYRKATHTCARPDHRPACSLPSHPLRKGALNQAAYSLYLFLRDRCRGDLVAWIDERLLEADLRGAPNRPAQLRQALLDLLIAVQGVGPKVLSMALSDLLLGADPKRERWVTTGASLIVVDTLVHNWMHRTGTLRRLRSKHAYGPACYRPGGCATIIEAVASRIDARQFGASFPATFPRYLQKAIWQFCAESGRNVCNGNQIDDSHPCANRTCCLSGRCRRVALRPALNVMERPEAPQLRSPAAELSSRSSRGREHSSRKPEPDSSSGGPERRR
ncbi:hypothetical protein [Methylobacterium nigriterrae]|uniref:hypothetical protein n=1 Tax=Methylobacterium nigriterrae TaxID=3127512 RepID=UPI003013B421